MRLSSDEVSIIKSVILRYIPDAKIMLFGSRVDDAKRGGDIDIFVETREDISLKVELEILARMEILGVLRRVDLVLKTPKKEQNTLMDTILKEGVVL